MHSKQTHVEHTGSTDRPGLCVCECVTKDLEVRCCKYCNSHDEQAGRVFVVYSLIGQPKNGKRAPSLQNLNSEGAMAPQKKTGFPCRGGANLIMAPARRILSAPRTLPEDPARSRKSRQCWTNPGLLLGQLVRTASPSVLVEF